MYKIFETCQAMTQSWNLIGSEVILLEAIIEELVLTDTVRTEHTNPIPIVCLTLTNIGDDWIYQMVETEEAFQKLKHN